MARCRYRDTETAGYQGYGEIRDTGRIQVKYRRGIPKIHARRGLNGIILAPEDWMVYVSMVNHRN